MRAEGPRCKGMEHRPRSQADDALRIEVRVIELRVKLQSRVPRTSGFIDVRALVKPIMHKESA